MSDWFATRSTAASIKAGSDLEMPFPIFRGGRLLKEVESGAVTEADIDQRVLKMLELRDRTKACHKDEPERSEISGETNAIIRELASSGMVLLKNEASTLPLDPAKPLKVAVVGEFATEPVVTGGGSASCKPQYKQKPLDFLQEAFGQHGTVQYAPGVRTRRIIPVAPTAQLTAADGRQGVDISYFNDDNPTKPILTEFQPIPHVSMLGQPEFKPGLHVPGSRLELTTTLTPSTTGSHTLAVRCTGAFTLSVNNTVVLSRPVQPPLTTEQFLFNHILLETRLEDGIPMTAGQPYQIHLAVHSRTELMPKGEPTPYSATLCFEEEYSEQAAIHEAADLVAASDVAIVFCGRSAQYESEGFDLTDMAMPANQTALIQAVAAKAKKTVLVMHCGNPIDVSPFVDAVDAVVLAHFPGQEGAAALVDLLTGVVNPSGRLATTWWKSLELAPSFGAFPAVEGENGFEIRYKEGVRVGYRCEDLVGRARWPFGFGLSYTTFGYAGLKVIVDEQMEPARLVCTVQVSNTGAREGREVVQLYVRPSKTQASFRPERELKAFAKVLLQPGESKVVKQEVDLKIACSYWDEDGLAWRLEEGTYGVQVGDCQQEFSVTKSVVWNHL
jgi:beta-glucosidase